MIRLLTSSVYLLQTMQTSLNYKVLRNKYLLQFESLYSLYCSVKSRIYREWCILVINNILLCDRHAHDRYKDTIFIVAINLPVPRATRNRRRANFGKWGGGVCDAAALVFVIYGRARHRSLRAAKSGTRCEERKIHERNFYRHTGILTLLLAAACSRARARRIGACGRYFTMESRATPIILRENGFLPRSDVRAVVPFAAVITSPRWVDAVCRDSAVRKPPAWRIMAACLLYRRLRRQYVLAVSTDPNRRPVNFQLAF